MPNSPEYLDIFRENGAKISQIRSRLVDFAQNHHNLAEIDAQAESLIKQAGGEPAFKKVAGYNWTTCICVNDCLVHGIPKGKIKPGDIVTIDVGMSYQETTTDVATTFVIGKATKEQEAFLSVGKKTLSQAIKQAKPGNTVLDITKVLQKIPESAGYSVTRNLVGHGLGKTMHEPPSIPCFVSHDPGLKTKLKPGMVITIEVMYMQGDWPLSQDKDGWSLRTSDGSISAMFEEDIIITPTGPEVISQISPLETRNNV